MTKTTFLQTTAIIALCAAIGFYALPGTAKEEGAKDQPAAATAAAPPAMPVSVAAVLQKEVTTWSEFSGRLRAVEDVQVRPRVSGAIDEMHFHEGDVVQKGDRLFTIDLRPYKAALDQANAALAAARARGDLARSDLKRAKTLFEQQAYSQREFDERNNGQKETDALVKAAEAEVELAQLNLEYAEVKSPITGRVGRPEVTVGNVVQAGSGAPVLTTVQSIDPIYADFDIDEQTYLRARKAVGEGKTHDMPVYMALADEKEFKREGRILSFDNQLSGDSGTMRVRAEFPNPDGYLTPGLFARIHLGNAEKTSAALINDAAVGTDQDRKFVYAVDDKGSVSYRPVTLGPIDNGLRVVEEGLKPGENIVVNGLMRVHPGMQVQPVAVAMDTLKPAGGDAPAPDGAASAPKEDNAAAAGDKAALPATDTEPAAAPAEAPPAATDAPAATEADKPAPDHPADAESEDAIPAGSTAEDAKDGAKTDTPPSDPAQTDKK